MLRERSAPGRAELHTDSPSALVQERGAPFLICFATLIGEKSHGGLFSSASDNVLFEQAQSANVSRTETGQRRRKALTGPETPCTAEPTCGLQQIRKGAISAARKRFSLLSS